MVSELRFLLAQGADLESNLHVQTRNHPSGKSLAVPWFVLGEWLLARCPTKNPVANFETLQPAAARDAGPLETLQLA
jgi:hypothetical protein